MHFLVLNTLNSHTATPQVNVQDRAFNYGDGCFTTMYAYNRCLFNYSKHISRLVHDTSRLRLYLDVPLLVNKINDLLLTSVGLDNEAIVVKIHISRGLGGRGYELPVKAETMVSISFHKTTAFSANSIITAPIYRLKMCSFPLSSQTLLAGIKHLNRLEQIMAKIELADTHDAEDLILADQNGNIIEAISANVFLKVNELWLTPSLEQAGVSGVMRRLVLEHFAAQGIAYKVTNISAEHLMSASSVFLTNAVKFIIPVSSYQNHKHESVAYNNDVLSDIANGIFTASQSDCKA